MTLEQLRIFLAVAEREHVTRAAEALHLTQSAVSAAVRALEGRHGITLFHRIGRRIELTEEERAAISLVLAASSSLAAAISRACSAVPEASCVIQPIEVPASEAAADRRTRSDINSRSGSGAFGRSASPEGATGEAAWASASARA